jgi:PadR family transcriptional regulator, regulatory protein PadR
MYDYVTMGRRTKEAGEQEARGERGELIKGNTPTLILAVLEQEALHGYAIAREIERRSEGILLPNEGSLYPALRALEADGYVTSRWEPQPSGPSRRVYELTESGRTELVRRTRSWREFAASIERVLGGKPYAQPT